MPIKVLHMNIDDINRGGAFELVNSIEKNIDAEKVTFSYLSMDKFNDDNNPESKSSKNNHSLDLRKNRFFGHILLPFYIHRVLVKCKFEIVHIHTDTAWKGLLYALPAKINGKSKVVVHSHANGIDGDKRLLKKAMHNITRPLLIKCMNSGIAASKEAARWLFGDKIANVVVIPNGIDLRRFRFDTEARDTIRNVLGVGNKLVIGSVGVVSETKNQEFMIDVLSELRQSGTDAYLLIVGFCSDEWKERLTNKAQTLGVEERVIIYGSSSAVQRELSAMDVFLFPSVFEGFGLAFVEAQATGLPSIASPEVPGESFVSNWAYSETMNKELWSKRVIEIKGTTDRCKFEIDIKHDIQNVSAQFMKIYLSLLHQVKE